MYPYNLTLIFGLEAVPQLQLHMNLIDNYNPFVSGHHTAIARRAFVEDQLASRYNVDLPLNKSVYRSEMTANRLIGGVRDVEPTTVLRAKVAMMLRRRLTKRITQLVLNFFLVSSIRKVFPRKISNSIKGFDQARLYDNGYNSDTYLQLYPQSATQDYKNFHGTYTDHDMRQVCLGGPTIIGNTLWEYGSTFAASPELFFAKIGFGNRKPLQPRKAPKASQGCTSKAFIVGRTKVRGKPEVLTQARYYTRFHMCTYVKGVKVVHSASNTSGRFYFLKPHWRLRRNPERVAKVFVESIFNSLAKRADRANREAFQSCCGEDPPTVQGIGGFATN